MEVIILGMFHLKCQIIFFLLQAKIVKIVLFDFYFSASSSKLLQRKSKKLVDELELKRRSNSQQQHLADYKMKQNLNRVKNCQSTSSRSGKFS